MTTRHLVDPDLRALLDLDLTALLNAENLAAARQSTFERPPFDAPDVPLELCLAPGAQGAPDVPLRVFTPEGSRVRPAILQIHGGGYVSGRAVGCDNPNRQLAHAHDAVVVAVDYRLAPENPFPAPLEDCYAALVWLSDNAEHLGVDPERIIVLGESAGGGLAAALALLARDRGGPRIAAQVLIYPMLDHRTGSGESVHANPHAGEFVWTRTMNCFGWQSLRGTDGIAEGDMGYFSPAVAQDLGGLPPAWIGAGALDLFVDEDVDYALRLLRAGVPAELHLYPGAYHGFDLNHGAAIVEAFQADLNRAIARFAGARA